MRRLPAIFTSDSYELAPSCLPQWYSYKLASSCLPHWYSYKLAYSCLHQWWLGSGSQLSSPALVMSWLPGFQLSSPVIVISWLPAVFTSDSYKLNSSCLHHAVIFIGLFRSILRKRPDQDSYLLWRILALLLIDIASSAQLGHFYQLIDRYVYRK